MKRSALLLLLVTVAFFGSTEFLSINSAFAQCERSFSSKLQFLSASDAEVRKQLGGIPLDPKRAIDKEALDLMKELDAVNNMSTKLFWNDGRGSCAHPKSGIGLDRIQVASFYNEVNRTKFREVIKFVLAHEQAHMAQFRVYSLDNFSDQTKTRAIECQADILGGLSVAASLLAEGKPGSYSAAAIKVWADLGPRLGSPEWDDQTKHPRPEQRLRAISLGLNAGLYNSWVYKYKQTKDPKILAYLKDWREKVPDLFEVDENLFVWSNRVAKKIVNYR